VPLLRFTEPWDLASWSLLTQESLCHELHLREIHFERQRPLPVEYKNVKLDCGYRLDVVVENKLVLEIKCVEHILPVHEAQLLTYLKMTRLRVG
jgi:GxxExxY protein